MSLVTQISTVVTRIGTEFKTVYGRLGDLTSLTTTNKTSLVAAINEVEGSVAGAAGINDSTTATTSTWSSSKVNTQLGTKQDADTDLGVIAALDSSTAGMVASDGAGWIKKTYTQVKTALGLVKGDVGLGNVDNTSDANKPVSTAQQTALNAKQDALGFTPENVANKGAANGYASLDSGGRVPLAQIPNSLEDIVPVANQAALPGTGTTDTLYITTDNNHEWRWTGSAYVDLTLLGGAQTTDQLAEGTDPNHRYFTDARADARINTLLDAQMGDETTDFVAVFNAALV